MPERRARDEDPDMGSPEPGPSEFWGKPSNVEAQHSPRLRLSQEEVEDKGLLDRLAALDSGEQHRLLRELDEEDGRRGAADKLARRLGLVRRRYSLDEPPPFHGTVIEPVDPDDRGPLSAADRAFLKHRLRRAEDRAQAARAMPRTRRYGRHLIKDFRKPPELGSETCCDQWTGRRAMFSRRWRSAFVSRSRQIGRNIGALPLPRSLTQSVGLRWSA